MLLFKKNTIILFAFLTPFAANTAELNITVLSSSGKLVKDAVITLSSDDKHKTQSKNIYIIDQIDKTYVPHVKIIPTGSKISFPNKDDIRHHVYSFSETKKFELPLYEGTPTEPVIFKKSGIVVLGCNIHDWMRGYIFVSDTPYYGLTKTSGSVTIKNIPKGEYSLQIWHPNIKNHAKRKPIKLNILKNISLEETISLKPSFKIRRAPKAKRRRY